MVNIDELGARMQIFATTVASFTSGLAGILTPVSLGQKKGRVR
jgi:hypothetical protein